MSSKTEELLASWEVTTLLHEERVAWVKTWFVEKFLNIVKSNDHPQSIIVHELLFDAFTEALQDIEVTTEAVSEFGITPQEFSEVCKRFPVRSAKTAEFELPDSMGDNIPVDERFTVFITLKGQQMAYFRAFDQRLGISQYIVENKIPLMITEEDIAFMSKMFILLQCMERARQTGLVTAKSSDLSSTIYKPQ